MAQRYIYLNEELNNKLKEEENASALICKLLMNHYELTNSPIDKLDELKREIEKKNQEAESLRNKIQEMENKREKVIEEEIKKENAREDSDEVWERRKKLQREAFNNYDVEKEKAGEVFEEFFVLLKSGLVKNMVEFCEEKGIKRKEKKKYA